MLKDSLFISNRTPMFEDGEIIGAVAVLQDISELENISRELEIVKELNRELDAIIESSHDGLYLTNGEGITLRVNEAFEKMTGVPASEMVGHNVEELVKERGIVSESVSALVLQQKTGDHHTAYPGWPDCIDLPVPGVRSQGRIFRWFQYPGHHRTDAAQAAVEQAQGLSKHYESELRALQMKYDTEKLIVGSRIMKDLLENVTCIAQVESTVLITGNPVPVKSLSPKPYISTARAGMALSSR